MGFGVNIGRALSDLPAGILIPIMVALFIGLGIYYAKGKIPRTFPFHSLIACELFLFAGYVLYILGAPQIVTNIVFLLGVISIIVSFFAFAHSIYHNESIRNRKVISFFLYSLHCILFL